MLSTMEHLKVVTVLEALVGALINCHVLQPEVERVVWIWLLIFAYFVPELGTFFRSARICLFKTWEIRNPKKPEENEENSGTEQPQGQAEERPKKKSLRKALWEDVLPEFLPLLFTEGCSAVGSALLVFIVFPELDVIKAAMLTNAVCFVPGTIAFFSRNPKSVRNSFYMTLDIVSLVAQASSFVIWPLVEQRPILYTIPVSVILISIGWWENFLAEDSAVPLIANLAKIKKQFNNRTYFYYVFLSIIKSALFFATVIIIFLCREENVEFLFKNFGKAFSGHEIDIAEIVPMLSTSTSPSYEDAKTNVVKTSITTSYMTPIWVWIINFLATYICFAFGKFGCKVMMQEFTFSLPVCLSVPVLISGLIAMCGSFLKNECAFSGVIPTYLFFNAPPLHVLNDFVGHQYAWIWLVWLLSQAWITVHIWSPKNDKRAPTEKLFIRPMYDAFLVDQSLALNRRRNEDQETMLLPREEVRDILDLDGSELNEDKVTQIYACATMWHEEKEEMMQFLKSICRLDQDQCANRIARKVFHYDIKSYYELETHIFFDDAFVRKSKKDKDPLLNEFVHNFVSIIDEAASKVHGTDVTVRPPKVYPTPYGGRLVYTLPGKTKMFVHLKDKAKIRAKKRWSQVMYMYYLLGFGIMANDSIQGQQRKHDVSDNTFILALDGDIDFQPHAVRILVDCMDDKSVGAACGRIHPVGSGGMAWYQMFEYAVGHWLQKATEHVIGCVLCSPGCFSLFRARALMDKSVMRKYATRSSEAAHYVQYDQGEDRWLCTLLLQRGYRVEYAAASDAYTHCPEGYNDFCIQRRRWMPSTMANNIDLLMDYKHTVKVNDSISTLYIGYQILLLIGTVLGPGSIFLMLVGAFVAAFRLDQWSSFWWNLVPILIFIIVCATCSSNTQLLFSGIISAIYGLIMMAVFVGIMLQISQDGFLAPSSLFLFCVAAEFIIAAIVHPKEFNCLKYGVVYYVTIPSMYLLLVIYSVFNMNNVSWGTREVTVVAAPKTEKENAEEEEAEEEQKKKDNKVMSFLGGSPEDNGGSVECSFSKLFKCMLCTYKAEPEGDEQFKIIQESLLLINKRFDDLERAELSDKIGRRASTRRPTTILEGSSARKSVKMQEGETVIEDEEGSIVSSIASVDVVENSWFYEGGMSKGEVVFLSKREEKFWADLIKEYLHPIQDNKKKMAEILKNLRDKMVFSFLMLNALYVLVVFLLTLEKDTLHLDWPIDPKVNFSYQMRTNTLQFTRKYLQLEPIGFVFLIFFALLMTVQFTGMLIHRFETFSQILTHTRLWQRKPKNATKTGTEGLEVVTMVKDMQKLKGINDADEESVDEPVHFRKTVGNLAPNDQIKAGEICDNEEAFLKRWTADSSNVSPQRRKTIALLNQRRQTIERRKSRMPLVNHQEMVLDQQQESPNSTSKA